MPRFISWLAIAVASAFPVVATAQPAAVPPPSAKERWRCSSSTLGSRSDSRCSGLLLLVHRGEQFAACLRAAATNLSADTAVVMVGRVAITLLGASATCDNTGLERGAYDADIGLGLTGHDPARRVAHVGAVKIEPNAPHQLGHVRLAETCVGAAGARGGAVEALVNAVQEEVAIKSDRPRMPLDDFSDCHFHSVPR